MAIQRVNLRESSGKKKELMTEDQWEEWIHHDTVDDGVYITDVPLEEIRLGDQVRRQYPEESIQELAESIRHQGLLQPIQLKREGDLFRIVYGHRRFLAVKRLGLPTIRAIVDYVSDVDILSKQIAENIQREDLHPIDEALGLQQLMEIKEFKQVELAGYVGKSKYYVTETLSILKLLKKVGHAQLFDSIRDKTILVKLSRISDENLLKNALKMVENGSNRDEIRTYLAQFTEERDREPTEKNRKKQTRDIETSSRRAIKMLENFRDEIMKMVMKYEGDLEEEDLKGLNSRFQSRLDELKELLSTLFKIKQRVESCRESGEKTRDPAAGSLVFPGTTAIASISYKLVSISFSFISYSYSYSSENKKREIIRFILKRLPNLERNVLEEATVEEIIDYWNSLPFKKIEKSVEGFFYQSLARRYTLPERYLELKAEALASLADAAGTGDPADPAAGEPENVTLEG